LLTHIYIGYLKNLPGPNTLAYFAAATVTKKKIFVTLISGQKCWTTVLAATSIEQVNIVTHSISCAGADCIESRRGLPGTNIIAYLSKS